MKRRTLSWLALAGMALVAVGSINAPGASAANITLKGFVACQKGGTVVGVWVESSAGGSKFAAIDPLAGAKWIASYSVTIPAPTSVRLDIGCGGSTATWGSNNSTPSFALSGSKTRDFMCKEASGARAVRCVNWGTTIFVGMPFGSTTGYWDRFGLSHPSTHPIYDSTGVSDWATDVYAPAGTAVYAKVFAPLASNTTLTWGGTWTGCAGTGVRVNIMRGTTKVGTVSYAHLAAVPSMTVGATISRTTKLGELKQWSPCESWQVSNADGVHTHIEFGQVNGYACYRDLASGTKLNQSKWIGKTATTTSSTKQAC